MPVQLLLGWAVSIAAICALGTGHRGVVVGSSNHEPWNRGLTGQEWSPLYPGLHYTVYLSVLRMLHTDGYAPSSICHLFPPPPEGPPCACLLVLVPQAQVLGFRFQGRFATASQKKRLWGAGPAAFRNRRVVAAAVAATLLDNSNSSHGQSQTNARLGIGICHFVS